MDIRSVEESVLAFAHHRGWSTVRWAVGEHVAWDGEYVVVRRDPALLDRDEVSALFSSTPKGLVNIEVYAVGSLGTDVVVCGVVIPESQREAEELRIAGLKISVPDRIPAAVEAAAMAFWFTKLRHGRRPAPYHRLATSAACASGHEPERR